MDAQLRPHVSPACKLDICTTLRSTGSLWLRKILAKDIHRQALSRQASVGGAASRHPPGLMQRAGSDRQLVPHRQAHSEAGHPRKDRSVATLSRGKEAENKLPGTATVSQTSDCGED